MVSRQAQGPDCKRRNSSTSRSADGPQTTTYGVGGSLEPHPFGGAGSRDGGPLVVPRDHEVGQAQERLAGRTGVERRQRLARPPGIAERHLPRPVEGLAAAQEIDDLLPLDGQELPLV